jgi:Outer membrane protein beta-barrel domain
MKKVFFISLLAIGFSANAQHFSVGLKGGANISNFTGGGSAEDVKKKALVGFYAGAYLNFWIGKNLSIQPEALISTQGVKLESEGETEKYKLTYVNVPVMIKYKTDGGFYIEAGPQVGFKLGESVPDQTVGDFAKNLDLSVGAGLGFQSAGGFGIGARYMAGISKVGDFEDTDGPNFKNSVIQIGISYTLGGPKKN